VAASDPDKDTITYSIALPPSGPSINSSTGALTWSSIPAGTYTMAIKATDSAGLFAEQIYTLAVASNSTPTITSTAPATVTAGLPYRYDVQGGDSDGDTLTYALSGNPTGMGIDAATGRITWSPTIAQIGTFTNIKVTVTDPYGNSVSQTFSVTVQADTTPPTVSLQLSANPIVINNSETFTVRATDNVGVTGMSLTVGGTVEPLDGTGLWTMVMSMAGQITVTATATDAAGNMGTATQTLQVTNPAANAPTVQITSPSANAVITSPTAVVGTISAVTTFTYTVTVIPFDGSPSKVIGMIYLVGLGAVGAYFFIQQQAEFDDLAYARLLSRTPPTALTADLGETTAVATLDSEEGAP
jgi:large repetitive protein